MEINESKKYNIFQSQSTFNKILIKRHKENNLD